MICTTPRTGGNWLDSELNTVGIGEPDEYLRYVEAKSRDWIHDAMRWMWDGHSPEGIFGIKVHWNERYGIRFIDVLPPPAESRLYIHLVRVDLDAQARSWALAREYQTWLERPPPDAVPDPDLVAGGRAQLRHMNGCWREWFRYYDIDPLRVTYEQMLMGVDAVVERIRDRMDQLPASAWTAGARRLRHSGMNPEISRRAV